MGGYGSKFEGEVQLGLSGVTEDWVDLGYLKDAGYPSDHYAGGKITINVTAKPNYNITERSIDIVGPNGRGKSFREEADDFFRAPNCVYIESRSFGEGVNPSGDGSVLDSSPGVSVRSGSDLLARTKSNIAKLHSEDMDDLYQWINNNPDMAPPRDQVNIRIGALKNALDTLYVTKKFSHVKKLNGNYEAIFVENGFEVPLEKLSSGQLWSVLQASFLISNKLKSRFSVALVDEPEISLHAEWQSKIFDFYRSALASKGGLHSQIIMATHSPFIIHGSAAARKIILRRRDDGSVSEHEAPGYQTVNGYEAVSAFNLDSFLAASQKQMLILTEGETDADIIRAAWQKLFPDEIMYFELRAAMGSPNIKVTLKDQMVGSKIGDRVLVGLFDFDSAFREWDSVWNPLSGDRNLCSNDAAKGMLRKHRTARAWSMLIPVPDFRNGFASKNLGKTSILSIEFLFEDRDIPCEYREVKMGPLNREIPRIRDDKKTEFARHAASLPAQSFEGFRQLFARFAEIASDRVTFEPSEV